MNTSSIESLPTDPSMSQTTTAISQIANNNQNITLETNEKPNNSDFNSQFEKELQMAVNNGNTSLPSRDIPKDTTTITNDNQTQPNYIPSSPVDEDYIQDYENSNDFLNYRDKQANKQDNTDFLFEQLKIPILISCLFFIFQLPFTKESLLKYSPMLFNADGNYNLYGYIGSSLIFGLVYYSIAYILDNYSDI